MFHDRPPTRLCPLITLVALIAAPAIASTLSPEEASRILRTRGMAQYYDSSSGTLEDMIDKRTWTCLDLEDVDEFEMSKVSALSSGQGFAYQHSTFEPTRFYALGTAVAVAMAGDRNANGEGSASSDYSVLFTITTDTWVRLAGEVMTYDVDTHDAAEDAAEFSSHVTLFGPSSDPLFRATVVGFDEQSVFDRILLLTPGQYQLEGVAAAGVIARAEETSNELVGNSSFSFDFTVVPAPGTGALAIAGVAAAIPRRRR